MGEEASQMNRGKKLLYLLLAFVIVASAAFAAVKLNPEEDETEEKTDILTLEKDEVTALSWTYAGEIRSFLKTDSGWEYTGDSSFPLDVSRIENILTALGDVKAAKTIESPASLSDYGLENPDCRVDVTSKEPLELLIGSENGIGGERYFSTGDGKVYLVDAAIIDNFSVSLYDLIKKEEIPTMTEPRGLRLTGKDKEFELVYKKDSGLSYSNDYVWFLKDGENYKTLDTVLAGNLIATVTSLNWKECVDYNAEDAELESYGLKTPVLKAALEYNGKASDEENGSEPQEGTAIFALEVGAENGESCYARLKGSNMVYLIDGSIYDTLSNASYEGLRPNEVLSMDWDTVTSIDASIEGTAYHIDHNTDGENNSVYKMDGKELSDVTFTDKLNNLSVVGNSDGSKTVQKEKLSFTFNRSAETFKEVKLAFYEYDDASYLASLDGDSYLLVDNSVIDSIAKEIKSFSNS